MSALFALIQIAPGDEKILSIPTFWAFESIRPFGSEKMVPAVLFRSKAIHKLSRIHFFLSRVLTSAYFSLFLLSQNSIPETTR
jgi:hypothetical protein